ncbi:MAG: hypothetical protein LBD99_04945 [Candidatus Margulisbacteria bacterium]|jgi:hypothetical protein|nr:hypothetical protein [Candidatus Margulisiibacteriota bacterium]
MSKAEKLQKEAKVADQSADIIYAENVACANSGVNSINAGRAEVSYSGVGVLKAQKVGQIEHSGIGILKAGEVAQKNCGNAVIVAQKLQTDSARALVTIADNIEGDVRTVLDKKGVAALGLILASILLFFRFIRRR